MDRKKPAFLILPLREEVHALIMPQAEVVTSTRYLKGVSNNEGPSLEPCGSLQQGLRLRSSRLIGVDNFYNEVADQTLCCSEKT